MNAAEILLLIAIALAIYCLIKYCKSYKVPDETLVAFTGTMGSGKTYNAVNKAVKHYKHQRLLYKLSRIIPIRKWKIKPHVYSNIPIRMCKNEWAETLTSEHLLMLDSLPEGAIVVIDEIGQFASQWEFDNPLVMEQTQTLVRFFRHFTNGHIYITDQSVDNIVKPIRSRMGVIYQLHDFRRLLGFLPFFVCEVLPLYMVDSDSTLSTSNGDINDPLYIMGFLPYRWMHIQRYDSRAYSDIYIKGATRIYQPDGYKTRYLIDLQTTPEERKLYKNDRRKYRDYLYQTINQRSRKGVKKGD